MAALLLASAPASGAISDTAVKAAFLPRFARYVTWPPSAMPAANQPMLLCVIGDDPFGNDLAQAIVGQQVDGHGFEIRRLPSAAGASGCEIAFVDGSRSQSVGQMLADLGRQPILTVTDSRDGRDRGIVHFEIVDGRVRFFIDNVQAQQHGLTISSRLLALAIGVNGK